VPGQQGCEPADVIGVMVRDEDRGQAQLAGRQRRLDRRGIARIDHHGFVAAREQP
jgi:hypothetical protein